MRLWVARSGAIRCARRTGLVGESGSWRGCAWCARTSARPSASVFVGGARSRVRLRALCASPLVVAALPAAPGALSLAGVGRYSGARPQEARLPSHTHGPELSASSTPKNVDGHIVPGRQDRREPRAVRHPARAAAPRPPRLPTRRGQPAGRGARSAANGRTAVAPPRLQELASTAVKTERSRGAASLFAAAATNIGRPNATPYFLRHAYASLRLAEQRLSLQEIAEEMGHTVEILARTYAHVILEYHGRGPIAPDALDDQRPPPRNAPKRPSPTTNSWNAASRRGDSNPRPHHYECFPCVLGGGLGGSICRKQRRFRIQR